MGIHFFTAPFLLPGMGKGARISVAGASDSSCHAVHPLSILFQIFLPELPCQSQRLLEQEEMESPHGVQKPEGLLDGSKCLPAFGLFLCRCICLLPCMQPFGKECAQKCEQDHFENAILVIHDHHLYPYHSKGESVRQGVVR